MKPETIYYADEGRNGVTSHPLGDIFFLTTENELVVIDITASGHKSKAMSEKSKHSKQFINCWKEQVPTARKLIVALISPIEEGRTKISENYPELRYISGRCARELLWRSCTISGLVSIKGGPFSPERIWLIFYHCVLHHVLTNPGLNQVSSRLSGTINSFTPPRVTHSMIFLAVVRNGDSVFNAVVCIVFLDSCLLSQNV